VEPASIKAQLREACQQADETNRRIQECEQQTLVPLKQEREQLAALTQQLVDLQSDGFLTGKPADTSKVEADIAACTARIRELSARADYVTAAHTKLTQQVRGLQERIRTLQEALPRQWLARLDQKLTDRAKRYREARDHYSAEFVETVATFVAYNQIGSKVPGFTAIGTLGLASLDLPVFRHPAFRDLGGLQKLQARVDARMREILRELEQS
jgi:hypothetical protein